MIKVHIFHTGKVQVDSAIPLHERNPLAVTGFLRGQKKKMILPVSCYLIEHPKGKILIDTGWDTKYAHEKPKERFGLVNKISMPIIKENQGIDSKLKNIGLSIKDIDAIYISHMDFDHVSGLRLVKGVKNIYTAKEELKAANKLSLRYIDTWTDISKIKTFVYKNTGLGPIGKSYDVFGDKTVQLISIPGHSYGLFAVKIANAHHYLILANDGAYLQESFDKKRIPGFVVNKKLAIRSLNWLCKCRNDKRCIAVIANHDPCIKEQIITI